VTAVALHLGCIALVILDLVARAFRIQWLVRAQGQHISILAAIEANALGDAACAVTPLRLGGEAARIAGLARRGLPALASVAAIAVELLVSWPVTLLCAAVILWRFAPGWRRDTAPVLAGSLQAACPWLVAIAGAGVACWFAAKRWAPAWVRATLRPIGAPRLTPMLVIGGAACSLVNVVARVGVLPLLALSLETPPAMSTLIVGSFGLLYSQLFLPMPSGLGAVDLGFLTGAAGSLGPSTAGLLLAWRFYTSGVGLVLGVGAAIRMFGWSGMLARIRGLKTTSVSERDRAVTSASPP